MPGESARRTSSRTLKRSSRLVNGRSAQHQFWLTCPPDGSVVDLHVVEHVSGIGGNHVVLHAGADRRAVGDVIERNEGVLVEEELLRLGDGLVVIGGAELVVLYLGELVKDSRIPVGVVEGELAVPLLVLAVIP